MKKKHVLVVQRAFILHNELVLAVQRAPNDRHNARLWEVPGGKIDAGEDPAIALVREIQEETGLTIRTIDQIVHMSSRVITDGRYSGSPYITLSHIGTVIEGTLRLSNEHVSARWCTFRDLMHLPLTQTTREATYALSQRMFSHSLLV